MNGYKAPGSTQLLITGIFYIILASLFLLIGLPLTACVAILEPLTEYEPVAEPLLLIVLSGGSFSLVVGILGVVHRNNIEKSKMLFRLGIVMLILDIVGIWLLHQVTLITIIFLPLSLCYISGARKNKKLITDNGGWKKTFGKKKDNWQEKLYQVKVDAEKSRVSRGFLPKNPKFYDEYLRKHKLDPLPINAFSKTSTEGAHYNSGGWSKNPNMINGQEFALFNEGKIEVYCPVCNSLIVKVPNLHTKIPNYECTDSKCNFTTMDFANVRTSAPPSARQ